MMMMMMRMVSGFVFCVAHGCDTWHFESQEGRICIAFCDAIPLSANTASLYLWPRLCSSSSSSLLCSSIFSSYEYSHSYSSSSHSLCFPANISPAVLVFLRQNNEKRTSHNITTYNKASYRQEASDPDEHPTETRLRRTGLTKQLAFLSHDES